MEAGGKLFAIALLLSSSTAFADVAFPDRGLTADAAKTVVVRHEAPHHRVVVDPTPFDRSSPGTVLALPGTDGAPIHARFEALRADTDGNRTWIGRVDTEAGPQSVVITFGPDAVFGFIPQRTGPALELTTLAGTEWIVEASPNPPRPPKTDAVVPTGREIPAKATGETEYVCAAADCRAQVPLIDVLVVYSADVVTRFGTEAAVRTRIAQYEQLTNQVWFDSEAGIEMRVVASSLVDYSGYELIEKALSDMYNPAGTPLKTQVDALRAEYGADLVTMLRDIDKTAFNGTCGIAYIGGFNGTAYNPARGYAANVVGHGSCPELTFTHELGHNLGSAHDQQTLDETGESFAGHFPYSRGHRAGGFSTVMGYPGPGQAHLALLSNPRLGACQAQPCGIADYADNARSHTDGAADVSAYFPTVVPVQGRLYISDAAVREGHSGTRELVFTICLSRPSSSPVSFDVETEDGTAQAASDYVSKALTDVTLAPGETSTTFAVVVNGDTLDETDETLSVWLRDPIGAPIVRSRATGTIQNDDTTLTIDDVATYEDDEGSKLLDFHVRLSMPVHDDVTFRFSTLDGTAVAPVDYVARDLTGQRIVAGETLAMYGIRINGDTVVEPDETFKVRATGVVGAKVGDGVATGTIRLDDTSLAVDDVAVLEGEGGATFTVRAKFAPVKPVSFRFRTIAGTATQGRDYQGVDVAGPMLEVGQTTRTFHVPVVTDDAVEPDETFEVVLGGVSGARVTDGSAIGTIHDDDLGTAVIRTIGGDGAVTDFGGDARLAQLQVRHVAAGVDGDVWISDRDRGFVARIAADGRLELVAGGRSGTPFVDGGPAGPSPMQHPYGIDVAADGTAYVVDAGSRIVAIRTDGTIHHIAGGGTNASDAPTPVADVQLGFAYDVAVDGAGNLYWADRCRVRRLGTDGIVRTIAGILGVCGYNGDGIAATTAHLNQPRGVGVDAAGRVYIADTMNHRIRVVAADGTITTLAGDGTAQSSGDGGPAAFARVREPQTIDVTADGTVYFTDLDFVVRRITAGRVIHTVAGLAGSTTDVPDGQVATTGRVQSYDVAAGVDGEFFVSTYTRVRRVGRLGLPGAPRIGTASPGNASAVVRFDPPQSTGGAPITGYLVQAVGGAGVDRHAYQPTLAHRVESLNNGAAYRFVVRAINEFGIGDASEATDLVTPALPEGLPRIGIADAEFLEGQISPQVTITLDRPSASTVTFRLVSADGTAVAGQDYTAIAQDLSIVAGQTQLQRPVGITVDAVEEGEEYLTLNVVPVSGVQAGDASARVVVNDDDTTDRIIDTIAGDGTYDPVVEGAVADGSPLGAASDLAVAPDGTLHFLYGNTVWRIAADGRYERVAGTGTSGESGDGGLARNTALLSPRSIAFDAAGRLYIGTMYRIRRVEPDGTMSTPVGATAGPYSGEAACPARQPVAASKLKIGADALLVGPDGAIYAGSSCAIWRIDRGGLAVPLTGRLGAGDSGDGGLAVDAQFQTIRALALHPDGRLLVGDAGISRVRAIGTDGVVRTVATGATAEHLVVDPQGRIFIGHTAGSRVMRVVPGGTPLIVVGNGNGFDGDGGPATLAKMTRVQSLATDATGNLYFFDTDNRRLRKVGTPGLPGAPAFASGVQAGDGRVTFAIGPPTSDGGSAITDYVVVSEPAGGTDLQAGTAATTRTITGLANGVRHRFAIRARNAVGLGPASPWSAWVKPLAGLAPALVVDDAERAEGASGTQSMVFTVRLAAAAPAGGVSFDVATSDVSAVAGSDYTAVVATGRTIAEGATTATVSVPVRGDTAAEGDETFKVTLTNVQGATRADGVAIGTIRNDDGRRLSVADVAVDEGDERSVPAGFVVSLDSVSGSDVRFTATTVDGTARAGEDFAPLAAQLVRIPAGQRSVTVPVAVSGDRDVEGDERFGLVIADAAGATLFDPVGEATVRDDDRTWRTVRIGDAKVDEGDAGGRNLVFDVTLSSPATEALSVVAFTRDASATAGADYTARSATTLTFPAGQTATKFSVTVRGDTVKENDELVYVYLANPTGGVVVADGHGVGRIVDDESRLSIADIRVIESGYNGEMVLSVPVRILGQPSSVPVTFSLATVAETASPDSATVYNEFYDYVALSGPYSISAGLGQTVVELRLRGDQTVEPDERLRLVATDVVGAAVEKGEATIDVLADDVGSVALTDVAGNGSAAYAGEGVAATSSIHSPWALAVDANGAIYFSERGAYRIRKLQDGLLWTIAGTGTSGFSGDGGPATAAQIGVVSDIAVAPDGAVHFVDSGNRRIRRIAGDGTITTVAGNGESTTSGDGGPATAAGLNPGHLAIDGAGRLYVTDNGRIRRISTGGTITTVAGTGTAGSTGDGGPALEARVTPGDLAFDPEGVLHFVNSGSTIRYLAADGTVHSVRGQAAPAAGVQSLVQMPQTPPVATFGGSVNGIAFDAAGDLYLAEYPRILRISRAGVIVPVVGSSAGYSSTLLANPQGIAFLDGRLHVTDFENYRIRRLPVLTRPLAPTEVAVVAGNGSAQLEITPPPVSAAAPVRRWSVRSLPAGAVDSTDPATPAATTRTITGLQNGVEYRFLVRAGDDRGWGETFVTAPVRPFDPAQPTLTVTDVARDEGDAGEKAALFTVRLSAGSNDPVSFDIATANGTATANGDYIARKLTGVTLPPGYLTYTFPVTLVGDTDLEATETFTVDVTNVSGAALGDGQAVGKIRNDDLPRLAISDVDVVEGDGEAKSAVFTVSLNGVVATDVTYGIRTADGTATAGSDYLAKSLVTHTIAAGATSRTYAVPLVGDDVAEPDETVRVLLSSPTGATIGDGEGIATIVDDDSPPVLSIADMTVVEGDSGTKALGFTVTLSKPAEAPVTYNIRTVDGTAIAGGDYVQRTLVGQVIDTGLSSRRFFVTINGDTAAEPDESFEVRVTSIVGATRGDATAIGTIDDDDTGPASATPVPTKPGVLPLLAARDDRFVLRENAPAVALDVLGNDVFAAPSLAGGSLSVVDAGRGAVEVVDAGTASPADDRVRYRAPVDAAGPDAFAYRLCDGDGRCVEALAEVVLRPALDVDVVAGAEAGTGDVAIAGLRALPSATYAATALVAPSVATPPLAVDPSPQSPWDADGAGTATVLGELPASPAPGGWTLLVDAQGADGDVDLIVGLDDDGDGAAERDEVRCTAAMSTAAERCELALAAAADAPVRYWVLAHNRAPVPQPARLELFVVPMAAGDGTLAAEGPVSAAAGEAFALRIDWHDPTLAAGEARVGYVRLFVDGEPAGSFPVRIDRVEVPQD